jgi:hypothetical protein
VASISDQNPRPAVLHLPAGEPKGKEEVISGILHAAENRRLTILTQQKLRPSMVLAVECNDTLFLGEVVRGIRIADGSWRSEIEVEQILRGLMGLWNLREHLFGDKNQPDRQINLGVYS